MSKKLEEMSLEELWQLFPIVLTEHREEWEQWYEEEKASLTALLPPSAVFHHIGSTAIAQIWAKPIVDILIEFPEYAELIRASDTLTVSGYRLMSAEGERISLNKGYTEDGFAERVFHIHLRLKGDCDEILFRDALDRDSETAKEYERLKLGLWERFEHNRNGYTEAKTDFITAVVKKAKAERAEDK